MSRHWLLLCLCSLVAACSSNGGTLSELESVNLELKDVKIEGGLDKAMESYQKFLTKTPESQMTPEALRRLADLKVEKEYGALTDEEEQKPANTSKQAPQEKEKESTLHAASGVDLENKNAREAIRLYKKLLKKYPNYERNDQVLYQLTRAYEEIGKVDKGMATMNRLVKEYPTSRYLDEVHFRRGEYYFTRKKFLDAEDAYGLVLKYGVASVYYERALYKKGWTYYKQELYEEALTQFIQMLDHKSANGYDFDQTENKIEKKRISDTFRVISLSFSNLGGAESVQEYFAKRGIRPYEDKIYKHLAEFFFKKRRYSDAASTYNAFVKRNQFHKVSPHFSMRVIAIYKKGRFPKLVIEAKKQFASTYGIHAAYWNYFNKEEYPKVLGYVKENIFDLAKYYHSLYQNRRFTDKKAENFREAAHWYKEFLKSFPKDKQSPQINYQLAELYLQDKKFIQAAMEFERTAYEYTLNNNSHKAAYAAIFARSEFLKTAPPAQHRSTKREIIRVSMRLVDTFPKHKKADIVLAAAVDQLFEIRDFPFAIKAGRRMIAEYPKAEKKLIRGAWLVIAHASFDTKKYADAEEGYIHVLRLSAMDHKDRIKLVDNLAASIYKQGEEAKDKEEYKVAVKHFLRIAKFAPRSSIQPTAEYDAAAILIQIRELEQAEVVLLKFRKDYPTHKLQHDITKKIAFVYKEAEKYAKAAVEFERIETESKDENIRREALNTAAELYEKIEDNNNALRVYRKYVGYFPKPVEDALEVYFKIAMVYKSKDEMVLYRKTLQHIIDTDATAGAERTDRTRYLAAKSSLVIVEPQYEAYIAIKLSQPFKKSLKKKQKALKSVIQSYSNLTKYQVADVTAASTYYIAEVYFQFNIALMQSERPKKLSELELEEYNLVLEEQAFPFEEKAIAIHEKNMELLAVGVYSSWIDKSLAKLANLLPSRYAKFEEKITPISDLAGYRYISPYYARHEARTGPVTRINIFRYPSQKLQEGQKSNTKPADKKPERVSVVTPAKQALTD